MSKIYRDIARSLSRALAIAFVVAAASGCNGEPTDGADGMVVWPANATKMVAEDHGGGFTGPAPTGSGCPFLRQGNFTFTPADKMLAWHVCGRSATTALYEYTDGSRVLTDAESKSVVTALKAVTVSTQNLCGADKETLTLTVTTPQSERTYLDDFYSCQHTGIYVHNIDDLFSVVRDLAK